MKPKNCQSAGMARSCGDCKHNPSNQMGPGQGHPIKPTITHDLKCAQWSAMRTITPSQTR